VDVDVDVDVNGISTKLKKSTQRGENFINIL